MPGRFPVTLASQMGLSQVSRLGWGRGLEKILGVSGCCFPRKSSKQ